MEMKKESGCQSANSKTRKRSNNGFEETTTTSQRNTATKTTKKTLATAHPMAKPQTQTAMDRWKREVWPSRKQRLFPATPAGFLGVAEQLAQRKLICLTMNTKKEGLAQP